MMMMMRMMITLFRFQQELRSSELLGGRARPGVRGGPGVALGLARGVGPRGGPGVARGVAQGVA